MQPSRIENYRTLDSGRLCLHLFLPSVRPVKNRAGLVFFFGGGWTNGTVTQFYPQASRLAELGLVAACAEYRIASLHHSTPFESVDDARTALRWLRQNAADLQLDPRRLAAGGGSAGGHLAACTALAVDPAFRPDALVLFNPVLDTTERGYGLSKVTEARKREISPCHHVSRGIPPTLIMHGDADQVAPHENAERFTRLMLEAGNDCRLVSYPGRAHGFFNRKPAEPACDIDDYSTTLREAEKFLDSLGFLH